MAHTIRLQPGTRVKVIQTIQRREGPWETWVEGAVVSHVAQQTGSWFAHAPNGRLWLNRLTILKEDGELVSLSLDERSRIIVLDAGTQDQRS